MRAVCLCYWQVSGLFVMFVDTWGEENVPFGDLRLAPRLFAVVQLASSRLEPRRALGSSAADCEGRSCSSHQVWTEPSMDEMEREISSRQLSCQTIVVLLGKISGTGKCYWRRGTSGWEEWMSTQKPQ